MVFSHDFYDSFEMAFKCQNKVETLSLKSLKSPANETNFWNRRLIRNPVTLSAA